MNEETADQPPAQIEPTNPRSKRFTSQGWKRWLVPALLALILLGLLFTLIVVGLSVFGLTPGA
jgi:hypothetical protein